MTKYQGSCHCAAVKFEVDIDPSEAMACNCSICQRKGTLLVFSTHTHFKLLTGADKLQDYQFGKKTIHHTFCKICGVTPFASGKMPDGTETKAINIRCLEDIELDEVSIHYFDGKSL